LNGCVIIFIRNGIKKLPHDAHLISSIEKPPFRSLNESFSIIDIVKILYCVVNERSNTIKRNIGNRAKIAPIVISTIVVAIVGVAVISAAAAAVRVAVAVAIAGIAQGTSGGRPDSGD
jgi:hypothetical protein